MPKVKPCVTPSFKILLASLGWAFLTDTILFCKICEVKETTKKDDATTYRAQEALSILTTVVHIRESLLGQCHLLPFRRKLLN